jgi:hypothetical protein
VHSPGAEVQSSAPHQPQEGIRPYSSRGISVASPTHQPLRLGRHSGLFLPRLPAAQFRPRLAFCPPPRIPLPHGRGRSPRACHRPKAIPRRGEASIRLAGPPRAAAPCWRPSRGNRRARRAGAGWPVGRWATMPTTSPTGPGRTLPRASRVPHQTALGPPRPPGQGRRNPERTVRYGDRSLCTASVEPACAPPVESPEPQDRPTGFQVGRARVWRPEQK